MRFKHIWSKAHLREGGITTTVVQHKRGLMDMLGCTIIEWGRSPMEISAAPLMGRHTEEILAQFLGYDSTQVKQLGTEGVI